MPCSSYMVRKNTVQMLRMVTTFIANSYLGDEMTRMPFLYHGSSYSVIVHAKFSSAYRSSIAALYYFS